MASFPVKTATFAARINEKHIDFVVSTFADRVFIIVTEFGKVGNLIEVRKDVAQEEAPENNIVFSVRVLFGQDDETLHVSARFLAELLDVNKPLLLSLAIKDRSPATLRKIAHLLKDQIAKN